ncbi:hypothetical protein FE374_09355 [Georgenia yuyongxinii]|uniref:Prohead serine protease domain-containing protein n=1 Tax=Georgenia yuyongxinii TaxID=2589797 RepID=A0A5B8C5Y4_9MICO|nr:HK97 family phage prohead protease [Georgenia yuyongxinii]QDC24791.1 hypothetical protein FE374_09355 [Georgenia yuyongxinii]
MSEELLTREATFTASDVEAREVVGIAVPWEQPTDLAGYREQFARGSVVDSDEALLFYGHAEPIGRVIRAEDTDAGWEITARISETARGDEVLTLLRDEVLTKFSVGFRPVEARTEEDGLVTRTKVNVREVSVVPFPAYAGASISEVRERPSDEAHQRQEGADMPDNVTAADLEQVRASIEDLDREVRMIQTDKPTEPVVDTRSAGEVLKAIASGDEAELRAYTGGTTADTVAKNGWVGDLTRLVDEAATLRGLFSTGNLPAEGNFIEYAVLGENTAVVGDQGGEGKDLPYGKVTVTTATAPVKTYGGYTQLTRQEIERSSVAILDHNLRAQSIATGKALNAAFRTFYAAQVAAQTSAGNTVEIPAAADYTDWLGAVVDAAEKYEDLGVSLDALVVDKTIFKTLLGFTGSDGRPMMSVDGSGANTVGSLDVKAISGSLATIPVRLNAKQAAPGAAFVNRLAIRSYNSPAVRLQDENIINLSKDFSVYLYSALAAEIPAAIVPVVEAA